MSKEQHNGKKLHTFLIYVILALLTIAGFEPVRHNDFVSYDDDRYVTDNPHVNKGISFKSIAWAFTATRASNWHPLTWLSHILDCELFGLNPFWHHLTNLLFHIANTLLLFRVLALMTGAHWRSAFVAAAFALHPLHVESVAWVAERKDVLSCFFWMLTIAAYIRYSKDPCVSKFLPVILLFCLGLMAKPMVVTLPFVFLLLDYWPIGRLQRSTIYKLLREKIPLFVLTMASCIVTYVVQEITRATQMIKNISVATRISNAFVSYVGYIGKTVYPSGLAVLYPHRGPDLPLWQPVVSAVVLGIVTVLAIYLARLRKRYVLFGWLWYIGTLVPVIGIIQVGRQAMADRYTYIPSIGLFVIVAWGVPELLEKRRYRKTILSVTAAAALTALLICTRMQLRHWKNNFALYEHALSVTKDNAVMHNNLGNTFKEENNIAEAIKHYRQALLIEPDLPEAHRSLANELYLQGKFEEATEHLRSAIRVEPNHIETRYNLGLALSKQDKLAEAIAQYRYVLQVKPDYTPARYNLGNTLLAKGEVEEAIAEYRETVHIDPNHAPAYTNLGGVLAKQNKWDEAVDCFRRAAELEPNNARTHYNLGQALELKGSFDEAIKQYRQALQINPAHTNARQRLEAVLAKQKSGR